MTPARVAIRAAVPGDIAGILPLIEALARHHGDTPRVTAASLFRDLFGQPVWMQALVAQRDDEILGYCTLLPLARLHLGQRGMDLHHLFVRADARGAGVGRALTGAALDLARALGCSYLTVSTHPDNQAAKAYYLGSGFFPAPPAPDRFAFDLSAPKGLA